MIYFNIYSEMTTLKTNESKESKLLTAESISNCHDTLNVLPLVMCCQLCRFDYFNLHVLLLCHWTQDFGCNVPTRSCRSVLAWPIRSEG